MKLLLLIAFTILISACAQIPLFSSTDSTEGSPLVNSLITSESTLYAGQRSTTNLILHNTYPHPITDLTLNAIYTGPLLVDWIPCPNTLRGTNDIPSGERASCAVTFESPFDALSSPVSRKTLPVMLFITYRSALTPANPPFLSIATTEKSTSTTIKEQNDNVRVRFSFQNNLPAGRTTTIATVTITNIGTGVADSLELEIAGEDITSDCPTNINVELSPKKSQIITCNLKTDRNAREQLEIPFSFKLNYKYQEMHPIPIVVRNE